MPVAIFGDYYSGLQNGLFSGNARLKNTGSYLAHRSSVTWGKCACQEHCRAANTASFQVVYLPSTCLPRLLGPSFNSGQVLLPWKCWVTVTATKALLVDLGPLVTRYAPKSLQLTVELTVLGALILKRAAGSRKRHSLSRLIQRKIFRPPWDFTDEEIWVPEKWSGLPQNLEPKFTNT